MLFTETAPWASLVQRFGRCNRSGEDEKAKIFWIPLPRGQEAQKQAAPYELEDLLAAEKMMKKIEDASLGTLSQEEFEFSFEHTYVIRRRDFVDLFDTTPDLAGNDMDVDRFIREGGSSDVYVFWRNYEDDPNEDEQTGRNTEPPPRREELCPAPIVDFKDFLKSERCRGKIWFWNFRDGEWERAEFNRIAPGQIFLLHSSVGGYAREQGWTSKSNVFVEPVPVGDEEIPDSNEADPTSALGGWQTIAQHTDDLVREIGNILNVLPLENGEKQALLEAARWHDRGKAHFVFQERVPEGAPNPQELWAKAPGRWKRRYIRRHFRHELASALAVLDPRNTLIPEGLRDLVAYLVAAHHGKIRMSIRSFPDENRPKPAWNEKKGPCRFARGIWEGDRLPETDLGGDVMAPKVELSLEPMELGLCQEAPFEGQPSWMERMIRLRDTLGPFRLAYLEAILRAADMRASREAQQATTFNGRGTKS